AEDCHLKIWDVAGARELGTFEDPAGYSRCVAISPDGKWLALGGQAAALQIRDAASGRTVRTMPAHAGGIGGGAFSPDRKRLASAGRGRAVKVWDGRTRTELT